MNYRKPFLIALMLLFAVIGFSGNLITSRKTSYYTYIYKITPKEAETLNKRGIYRVDSTWMHTLIDFYPTDSIYRKKLSPGHYLKTYSEKQVQKVLYSCVPDFDVMVQNNNTDLNIAVYDLQGNILQDAHVSVFGKKLAFDAKTKCYVQSKSNSRGLLKVTRGNYTAYYELKRKSNNPFLKRAGVALIAETPLIHLWRPLNYLVRLPIDGVKSLLRNRSVGVILQTNYFFQRMFQPDRNLHYKGYMVFSKPKYLPGDTVKFKAFLVNKNGKPLEKTIYVSTYTDAKKIRIGEVKPYVPGAYAFSFFLHDSLKLKLDRYIHINLENESNSTYIGQSFKYEDYELNPTKLEMRTSAPNHYAGKKFSVFAKGTDDNGLNLQDARLQVSATTKQVNLYFKNRMFVPDTLWSHQTKLKPSGETEIIIPDSIFPQAGLEYQLEVRMLTSDNKSFTQNKNIRFDYLKKSFDFSLIRDSLKVTYAENGAEINKPFSLFAFDNFDNKTAVGSFTTPFVLPLNVFYSSYLAEGDDLKETTKVAGLNSSLQCYTQRTSDSVFIDIENPRKLHFAYNIYQRNREISRGSGTSLNFKSAARNKQLYYIALRYLWGGKITEQTFRIPLMDKKLQVNVEQPSLVYPGQKANINIRVTDQNGKPVPGVDLTAFSMTSKFNYQAPSVPYLGKKGREKVFVNNFVVKPNAISANNSLILNYQAWKTLAGIDSIEYYRFIYPGTKIYRYEHPVDEKITQFAPFVVDKKGDFQYIQVVYLDNQPIYFAWSNNMSAYSFRVNPEHKHQLKIRLWNKQITLNQVSFKPGVKTILSIPDNLQNEDVRIEKMPEKFTQSEINQLNNYIFRYKNNFGDNLAVLRQGEQISLLNSENTLFYVNNYAAPVIGNVEAGVYRDYKLNFNHEPYFEYEFSPHILKMRSVKGSEYPTSLPLYNRTLEKPLAGNVLTEKDLERLYQEMKDNRLRNYPSYKNPQYTGPGYGKLIYHHQDKNDKPLNRVILKMDDPEFVRVYNQRDVLFHQLTPGKYQIINFYTGSRYFISDSVAVKANGINYYVVEDSVVLRKDDFGRKVSELIEKSIFNKTPGESGINQIFSEYLAKNTYTGEGMIVNGRILDESSEPVIGATVMVKGTKYGTISDMQGNFSMKVPAGNHLLLVSFIGYHVEEFDLRTNAFPVIKLSPDSKALDEVVVVGYGSQKKQSLVASIGVSSVEGALQGRLAGVSTSNDIRIRGVNSTEGKTPLIIVDGMVYTGSLDQLSPELIGKISVLKDAEATSIYGAAGANGVILIDSKGVGLTAGLIKENKGAQFDDAFLEASSQANSLRSNFSDVGFWQPKLITDANGKATFNTTFPDDVTNWQTMVLAMNGKRQSGQTSGNIKSYKPLMAQLATPGFLTEGDTCRVIGKTLNYLPDSVKVKSHFATDKNGAKTLQESEFFCKNAHIDTLLFVAPSDTSKLQYSIKRNDGYFDGEAREIPVVPVGLEETKGSFYILDSDTTIHPVFDKNIGKVVIYADVAELDVVRHEIATLIAYRRDCNEQMASKLKALLADKTIAEFKKEKFRGNAEVEKLIRLLIKNRSLDGWWGWWPGSETHYAFSRHILEALSQAKKHGFKVDVDELKLIQSAVWQLGSPDSNPDTNLALLHFLKEFDAKIDYAGYIQKMDSLQTLNHTQKLMLTELKQRCGIPCSTDFIKQKAQQTIFGNTYYYFDEGSGKFCNNIIQHTLMAYRILRSENAPDSLLKKIRRYFMETKREKYGWNTWEAAHIIETILPDILKESTSDKKTSLTIMSDREQKITSFPFSAEFYPADKISISKLGNGDVYLTTYQRYFNPKPKEKNGDFVIKTTFDQNKSTFEAGKPVKLIVTLEVRKEANYVMLNVPIPGGFSYENKTQNWWRNEYREYFKQETNIYCQHLPKGNYTYEISLVPRFGGTFTLNPAKVELMYFPVFNANNGIKKVYVR